MKKCYLCIFATILLTACTSQNSNEITTEIIGNITNFTGNIRIVDDNGENLADTNTVDGTFKIICNDTATIIASLYLNDISHSYLFIEGGSLAIQGDYSQKGTYLKISGTPSNDANMEMMKNLAPVFEKMYSVPESDKDSLAIVWDEYQQVVKNIYNKYNGKNLMAIKLLNDQLRFTMEPKEMLEDLSGYPEIYRNNSLLQFLKRHAENILKTGIGQPYIEIEQLSPDGSAIKLGDIIKKNSYTLVDFWASWCGPCMAEMPLLVEMYEKFHDKGFEIYGVSLDSRKDNWIKAIKDKQMKWPNVSDLKQWNCGPAQDYGVKGIPANFLIDKNGLIISKDLHGDELISKLSELLK